jgi:hypothetical protein
LRISNLLIFLWDCAHLVQHKDTLLSVSSQGC